MSWSPRREGSSWILRLRCPELPGVGGEVQELCCFPVAVSVTFSPGDSLSVTKGGEKLDC